MGLDANLQTADGTSLEYWRKHWDLHKFFVRDREDEGCVEFEIFSADIEEALDLVEAGEIVWHWYLQGSELDPTAEYLKSVISEMRSGTRVFYSASW